MSFNSYVSLETITDGTPITYGVVKPGSEDEAGVKFIRGGDVVNGKIKINELRTITNEVSAQYKRTLLQGGELLVSLVGNPGEVAVVPGGLAGCNIARQVGLVRTDTTRFNPWFVQYYLMSPHGKAQLFAHSLGSVQRVINLKELKRIEVPDVDLAIQNKIVTVLKDLDDKIELNRQINQTLEQIAQAIFKSWFVDFEPVRAKIKAKKRWQAENETIETSSPTCYAEEFDSLQNSISLEDAMNRAAMRAISGKTDEQLDQLSPEQRQQLAATAALFPDELVDSELGEIPRGWGISTIGNEVDVVGGGTPSTKVEEYWKDGEINWTSPKDLSGLQDRVLIKTEKQITEAGLAKISSGLLPIDTVLMSSRAPVGYLAQAKIPVAINQGYIAMKCDKRLPPEFVLLWVDSIMDEIKQRASGSTFAEISKKNFRPILVLVPELQVLSVFQIHAKAIHDKITEAVLETESLSFIRDLLLPKLLSGEIIVSEPQSVSKVMAL